MLLLSAASIIFMIMAVAFLLDGSRVAGVMALAAGVCGIFVFLMNRQAEEHLASRAQKAASALRKNGSKIIAGTLGVIICVIISSVIGSYASKYAERQSYMRAQASELLAAEDRAKVFLSKVEGIRKGRELTIRCLITNWNQHPIRQVSISTILFHKGDYSKRSVRDSADLMKKGDLINVGDSKQIELKLPYSDPEDAYLLQVKHVNFLSNTQNISRLNEILKMLKRDSGIYKKYELEVDGHKVLAVFPGTINKDRAHEYLSEFYFYESVDGFIPDLVQPKSQSEPGSKSS
jgi:hypothetical protein